MSFTCSVKFLGRSIIVKYTFHALHGTLVGISPHDCAPGHFSKGIVMLKLLLVNFDGHNANITLNICTDVVYIHVSLYKNCSLLS